MVDQEQINLSTKGHAYPHDLTPLGLTYLNLPS